MKGWIRRCLAAALLFMPSPVFLAAQVVESDGPGNIRSLTAGGRRVPITSDLVMPSRGWTTSAHSRWNATLLEYSAQPDGRESWRGRVSSGPGGPAFDYTQTRWAEGSRVRFQAEVVSRTSQAIEGVFLFLTFPVSFFGGGEARFLTGSTVLQTAPLPVAYGLTYLATVTAGGFTMEDREDRYHFTLDLLRPYSLTLQDNRRWGDSNYALFFALHSGNLSSGLSVSMDLTIEFTGSPDASPVTIAVDPAGTGDHFDGWGGNFAFNSHVPEVDWLLSELRVAWARAEVNLELWEPQNDNASSTSINWDYFQRRLDQSVETVRDFEIARKLKSRGIPLILSVWYLPGWLQPGGDGSKVPPENWNELLESIGSYLLTARDRYGFEADYFSFNEPDLGVYVLQSAAEHRDAVRSIGQYLQSLGLKTKLLIGDCANASNPAYVEPLAADPEALQYGGPVAYHTWNGSDPENYRRWREIATSVGRPLLATEVGSDPGAWHYPAIFWTYGYALDDLANYFGFLTHSRPQGALQWELTSDYPLVRRNADGSFTPSQRFWFVKHLANLTPPGAEYLEAVSPSEDVGVLVFRGSDAAAGPPTAETPEPWAIHLANFGPARLVHLTGFPLEAGWFRAFRTSATESMSPIGSFEVYQGKLSLELEAQSLTTLVGPEEASVLRFAHFAQGADLLSSRVILLNPDSGRSVSASIHFRDHDGAPLSLPLSEGGAVSSVLLEVPPRGVRTVETSASGPLTAGSATVNADGPLAGSVLFGGLVGLAGVASGAALQGIFQVPVEVDVSRGVDTGLALAAQSAAATPLDFELLSADGNILATASLRLPPWGHAALFAGEFDWDPPAALDNFIGSIRVRGEQPVVATVLQARPGEFLTLPVAADSSGPPAPFYFAQFGDGGGVLSSRISILNPGPETAAGTLLLRGQGGSRLVVDLNGQELTGALDFQVPPGGLATFTTDGAGTVQAGSVEVAADRPLAGVLQFTGPAGAAGVGVSPALENGFLLPVERRKITDTDTGVALHNLAEHPVTVQFRLRNADGAQLAAAETELAARGHHARFVTEMQWEPAVDLTDFLGVLEVRLAAPAAAVALLSRPDQLATLPVTPLPPEDTESAASGR